VPGQFDVVIVGGGPGGYAAALYGASAGLNVALVEKDKVGGTCLHRGCIPAKELLETAAVYQTVAEAAEFGVLTNHPGLDFSVTQARKNRIIDNLFKGLSGVLKARKVTMFAGTGSLGPNRVVTVEGNNGERAVITGEHVILAAGSLPRTIPGFDRDNKFVLTSDEVLSLESLPASVVVIGGGAIGCEFASMMSDLGSKVTLLEGLPKILPGCDDDVANVVLRSFKRRGIEVVTSAAVTGHTPNDDTTTTVHYGDGKDVTVNAVVVSVGRRPFSDGLVQPGTAVVVTDRGFIEVDEFCRTAEPGVYAVGDVIPTAALAHMAFAEAILVIKDLLGESVPPIDYGKVPWCIYCNPEVAFAGLTEQAAKDAGYDVVVSKHKFAGNGRAMIVGATDGLVKVIAEKKADGNGGRILGVHMAGPWVTEQLGQAYLAVNWEATVDDVAAFIQPHPTLSELFGETVLSMTGRSLHG
jgi:dihydrolipoamide dehydrogenase